MKKKTLIAAIIIFAFLISSVAVMQTLQVAKANPFFIFHQVDPDPSTVPPRITISSPQNDTLYPSDSTALSFDVNRPLLGTCDTDIIDVKYTFDSGASVQAFTIWHGGSASNSNAVPEFSANLTSPSLPPGNHQLTVTAEGVVYLGNLNIFFIDSSATTLFATGNSNVSSLIVVLGSPQNKTYTSSNVPISVTASDPSHNIGPQSVGYRLDYGPQKVIGTVSLGMHTITNSTVLSLSDGPHSIIGVGTTWFNGSDGVFYSQPLFFSVNTTLSPSQGSSPTPSPSPSPTPSPSPSPSLSPSESQALRPALEVIDVIKLRNYGGFYGAVYDSGTDEVYISNVDFNLVSVVSASNRTEIAEVPVGSQPLSVTYDSGKGEIFVANYASNSVSVISDSNRTVVSIIRVGNHPTAVAYDPGKGEVFVTNRDDNTVSVISDSTNTVVATTAVGKTPYGLAYSPKGEIFVTNNGDNSVSVISDSNNTVVATVQVGTAPYHTAYDSGKGTILVTNTNSSTVSVISDITHAVVANITVGNLPMGLVYDSGKGLVFVGNYGNNSVSVISDDTYTVAETINSQQQPFALAYDSTHGQIFVPHMESWSVSVISDSSDPSLSPTSTQKPTVEPSLTANPTPLGGKSNSNLALDIIGVIAIVTIAALGIVVYFNKRRNSHE